MIASAVGGAGAHTSTLGGVLPGGLSLASSGELSGTPTASGSYTFSITATDAVGGSDSQTYTVTINPAVSITTATLANWDVGVAGYSQSVSAVGGTGVKTFARSAGALPGGLSLASGGVLAG